MEEVEEAAAALADTIPVPPAAALDVSLPAASIMKIVKAKQPALNVAKDAKAALARAASIFVLYLSSTASDLSSKSTLSANDVVKALEEVDLPEIAAVVAEGLSTHTQQHKKQGPAKRPRMTAPPKRAAVAAEPELELPEGTADEDGAVEAAADQAEMEPLDDADAGVDGAPEENVPLGAAGDDTAEAGDAQEAGIGEAAHDGEEGPGDRPGSHAEGNEDADIIDSEVHEGLTTG